MWQSTLRRFRARFVPCKKIFVDRLYVRSVLGTFLYDWKRPSTLPISPLLSSSKTKHYNALTNPITKNSSKRNAGTVPDDKNLAIPRYLYLVDIDHQFKYYAPATVSTI